MQEPSPSRGVGVLAGVAAFAFVGVVDGLVALSRTPAESLGPSLRPLVVLHCAAVLLSAGFAWGLVGEALLAAGRRVGALRRFGRRVAAGPRSWFARDPAGAHAALNACLAVGFAVVPLFPYTLFVVRHLRSHALMALAVTLGELAFVAAAGALAVLLAPLVARALRALGPLASPGTVGLAALATLAAHTARFLRANDAWMRYADVGAAAIELALIAGNLAALVALGVWRHRARRALGWRALGAVGAAALAAFVTSALTFGSRQAVASAVFQRSVLSRHVTRLFQRAVDLDGDGYSAAFHGGDCDDLDARVHPTAYDAPGNGVDENCTGRDAVPRVEDGDGALAPAPPEYAVKPSILLLSIDALRPDHMGAYGYRRPTTPHLDAFAAGAARFTNAWCTSPRSLRSFASVWTGRYASQVAWGDDNQFPALEPENVTLAELLREAGYATAMFNNSEYFGHTRGFLQGFDEVREAQGLKDEVAPTVDAAAAWIRARAGRDVPWFAWVHLMEPHEPYRDLTEPRDFGHDMVDCYDEEVARADLAAQRVLDAVEAHRARRPGRPVVVVLMGDHGEGHNEHGVWHHSLDLHDEATRVPLIIRAPGVAPGPRAALASLMDLHPTLLNLAGLRPAAPVAARSLVPPLLDPSMPVVGPAWREHVFAEVTPDGLFPMEQKALWAPPFKLIWDTRRGSWELFDTARDPGELRNLFDERRDVAARMRDRLLAWAEGADANRSARLVEAARLAAPPSPEVPMSVRFGDVVELAGLDLPSRRVAVGASVRMTLYLRVLRRTEEPYWLHVFFVPEDGQGISPYFHGRHAPVQGHYPTTAWVPGERLRDDVTLVVERDVRPTRVRVRLAVEADAPGARLAPSPAAESDRSVDLGAIEIIAP